MISFPQYMNSSNMSVSINVDVWRCEMSSLLPFQCAYNMAIIELFQSLVESGWQEQQLNKKKQHANTNQKHPPETKKTNVSRLQTTCAHNDGFGIKNFCINVYCHHLCQCGLVASPLLSNVIVVRQPVQANLTDKHQIDFKKILLDSLPFNKQILYKQLTFTTCLRNFTCNLNTIKNNNTNKNKHPLGTESWHHLSFTHHHPPTSVIKIHFWVTMTPTPKAIATSSRVWPSFGPCAHATPGNHGSELIQEPSEIDVGFNMNLFFRRKVILHLTPLCLSFEKGPMLFFHCGRKNNGLSSWHLEYQQWMLRSFLRALRSDWTLIWRVTIFHSICSFAPPYEGMSNKQKLHQGLVFLH